MILKWVINFPSSVAGQLNCTCVIFLNEFDVHEKLLTLKLYRPRPGFTSSDFRHLHDIPQRGAWTPLCGHHTKTGTSVPFLG